ncbi:hypothetical protein JTE90_018643 [Oedothorax gibbosus]|uniref:Annexin n=1 Tax=Oedothorax gibbosus TaxID=931172 RepID=A0AAV6UNY5_9ARAC|nr:hypothetical protein JTE90_018643 [Oedothorax gibbosus]
MVDRKTRGTISPASDFNAENTLLKDDIRAELGGHFEDVCIALLTPLAEYIVDCLYFAIKGDKVDENCLKEILVSLEFRDLCYVKSIFKEKYNEELVDFIESSVTSETKHLMSALLSNERQCSNDIDEQMAMDNATYLYNEGLSKSWKSEEFLINLLATHSKMQLQATILSFKKIAGYTLSEAIKSEFSGCTRDALLSMLECIENRVAFFATQLYEALKKPKTDDATIIRILVSRSEVDLADIYEWYHIKYDIDLCEAIYADTSGDYRTILLKILNP